MSLPDYDPPSALKAILDSRSMAMQKKFGQNFLINANARTKLAESLDLQEGMKVWEVGPGLGALTTEILKRKANLTAFEIDRGFVSFLQEEIQPLYKDTFEIVSGDVLKTLKDYFALLFPTRFYTEGIPGTIIDAYAAGVPVISAEWESFSDIIDEGITGFGYAFGDKEKLKELLIEFAETPERVNGIKVGSLKKVQEFIPEKVVGDFIKKAEI